MNRFNITLNPVVREQVELDMLNDAIYNAEEARRANIKRQMDLGYNFDRINAKRPRTVREAVDVEFQPVSAAERVVTEAHSLTGAWWFGVTALAITLMVIKVVLAL